MLKIKEIRENKNLSQDKLVERTGIPKRTYVNYENGKSDIPFSKLQNIANALNVRVQDFIVESKVHKVNEAPPPYEDEVTLLSLKKDLKTIYDGLTTNFNTISEGVFHVLQDTQVITSKRLNKFLEEHK